jgi:hypothetical protein
VVAHAAAWAKELDLLTLARPTEALDFARATRTVISRDHRSRCEALIALRRYEEAGSNCTQAIEEMKDYPRAYNIKESMELRIKAYEGLGDPAKAAEDRTLIYSPRNGTFDSR